MTSLLAVCVAALLSQPAPESGAVPRESMLAAWAAIGQTADPQAAAYTEQAVALGGMGRDWWHETFRRYYGTEAFTANHEAFLAYLLGNAGLFEPGLPMASAATAEALAAGPWNRPAQAVGPLWPDQGEALLRWTYTLLTNLPGGSARAVATESLGAAFLSQPLALAPLFAGPAPGAQAVAPMRLVLLLAELAGPENLENWVELPTGMVAIYRDTGVLLWDGGSLSDSQKKSLGSLFASVPRERHGIGLAVVGEATGVRAASLNTDAPPFAIDLRAAPLSAFATGIPPESGMETSAPVFTLEAAEQLARALAYLAGYNRPDIGFRRDLILARAGQVQEAFVTLEIPSTPEELLPRAMYAWTADSERLLKRAVERANEGYMTVMESLLLLADLLSGGEDTAPAFTTSVTGQVTAQAATLHRVPFNERVLVTGITVGETAVRGTIDHRGYLVAIETD